MKYYVILCGLHLTLCVSVSQSRPNVTGSVRDSNLMYFINISKVATVGLSLFNTYIVILDNYTLLAYTEHSLVETSLLLSLFSIVS